jgi:hypothetical protein
MVWTTYDMSEITDAVVAQLTQAVQFSPLWTSEGGVIPNFSINVTGNSPDTMRDGQEGECQLNLYLLHVAQNSYLRNTPILGTGAMANTQQPLSLDLTYLLTAYCKQNADREQQAMSIALRWFHENPIYSTVAGEYLTIGLGSDTLSEMSALWQSFTVAYRLSTIYRVAVALITPSLGPATPFPPPSRMGLVAAPAPAPLGVTPQVLQTARQITFTIPPGNISDPTLVTAASAPLSITGGQPVLVGGQGLSATPPLDVFLATIDGATSWTVTGWVSGTPLASDLVLLPPASYAIAPAPPPPASTPIPGVYLLSVGAGTNRSPAVPVAIVPRFDNVLSPPILPEIGGVYTVTGAGFTPAATQLYLSGVAMLPTSPAGTPPTVSGFFSISNDGTTLVFIPPAVLPSGLAVLRVRVDGVDAPPTWQVNIP